MPWPRPPFRRRHPAPLDGGSDDGGSEGEGTAEGQNASSSQLLSVQSKGPAWVELQGKRILIWSKKQAANFASDRFELTDFDRV